MQDKGLPHMFGLFKNRSQPILLTAAMSGALVGDGLPPGSDPTTLMMVQRPGWYSSRRVNYFRVFDPARAAKGAVQVRVYDDLEPHLDLVLASGHIELDGAVVSRSRRQHSMLSSQSERTVGERPARTADEQVVAPD